MIKIRIQWNLRPLYKVKSKKKKKKKNGWGQQVKNCKQDKKSDDKNKISNFRPVSVFNIFSKVYEIVLKNALVSALSEYMSPFISAYWEGYSTQHVLVRLTKGCRNDGRWWLHCWGCSHGPV